MNNEQRADHPVAVIIDETKITVHLADGREISNPITWFPWLLHATPAQQQNYELWPFSIDWPDLDNGIDVQGMLQGIKPRMQSA